MRHPPARFLRPLLALVLLASAASVAGAQQSSNAASSETAITLTPEQHAVYVGVYEFSTPDGPRRIRIFEAGDRLMGQPEGDEEPSPLIPLGEHKFRPELAPQAMVTFSVEEGRAKSFTIVFPDERGTMVANRAP